MVWWWCWLLVTNTVFSVICTSHSSSPLRPAQTRHSGYTLYTKCPPARNTQCQPLVRSHATRQSVPTKS